MDIVDIVLWLKSHSTWLLMATPFVIAIIVVKILRS